MSKAEKLDPIDRLDRLCDLAAAIEVGLIGLRECNFKAASHGFGWIAAQIHDDLEEIVEELLAKDKKLRVVGGKEVRS